MRCVFVRILTLLLLYICLSSDLFAQSEEDSKNTAQLIFAMDNDWFVFSRESDRYYSFGLDIGLSFLPQKTFKFNENIFRPEKSFYTIRAKLEGYTPEFEAESQLEPIRRPFAGWLFGEFKINNALKLTAFNYGLQLGVMGPSANAGETQNWFHANLTNDDKVQGWENQVSDRVGLNVILDLYKPMHRSSWFDVYYSLHGVLGNIFLQSEGALGFRVGKTSPIKISSSAGNELLKNNTEYFIEIKPAIKMVGYDATLQSKPDIDSEIINNFRFSPEFSLNYSSQNLTFRMIYFYETNALLNEKNHRYGRMEIRYRF